MVGSGNADPAFTGQILAVRHCSPSDLGLSERNQAWPSVSGSPDPNVPLGRIRLTLRLPAQWQAGREPLIVSGVYPNCEMVYARYVGSDRLQLAYRQGTSLPILSEPIAVTPGSKHTVEVSLPSLALTRSPTEAKIGIRFDGQQLINENARVIAVAPDALYFGHFTGVVKLFRMRFTGEIVRAEFPDSESVSHLDQRSRTATAVP